MITAQQIASAMGGEARGNQAHFPTPGHSAKDRGVSVTVDQAAPDGFLVHVHNGGDALAIKADIMARLGLDRDRPQGWTVTETYLYADENGDPLYRTRRKERPGEAKRFDAQRHDAGTWASGLKDVRRVPYRLPQLVMTEETEPVLFAEGERKADRLAEMGFVATAIAFGAKGWRPEYAGHFRGRTVVILPDNDEPGRAFAAQVRRAVEGAGGRAVILELPGLPEKGDIMDWPGAPAELRALVEGALAEPKGLAARTGISARALMLKEFDPIRWVVPGYIVEGMTVLAGAPKLGKSWLMLGAAIAVGCGGTAFGQVECEAGDVLFLALEDNERRLKDRLHQLRLTSWPERVTFCTSWPTLDDGCCREIEAWAASVPNPRLVVVDVFARVRGSNGGRESAYDADYRFAAQLQNVASARRLGLVAIHHTRKAGAEDDPFDAVSGTRGLTGAADSVLVLKRPAAGGQHPILYGRGRDMAEVETAMEFDASTGGWFIVGDAAEIAKTEERQELLEVMGRSPDAMTATELAEAVGKTRTNVAHLLARMVKEGKVWKHEKGRYSPVTPFTHSLNSERSEQSDRCTLGEGAPK